MRLADVREGQRYTVKSGQSFVVLRKDVKADTVTIEALNRPSGPGSARRACVGEVREVSGRQWAASILEK